MVKESRVQRGIEPVEEHEEPLPPQLPASHSIGLHKQTQPCFMPVAAAPPPERVIGSQTTRDGFGTSGTDTIAAVDKPSTTNIVPESTPDRMDADK